MTRCLKSPTEKAESTLWEPYEQAKEVLYPISEHLLLYPMIAAAAMSFSSVICRGNEGFG